MDAPTRRPSGGRTTTAPAQSAPIAPSKLNLSDSLIPRRALLAARGNSLREAGPSKKALLFEHWDIACAQRGEAWQERDQSHSCSRIQPPGRIQAGAASGATTSGFAAETYIAQEPPEAPGQWSPLALTHPDQDRRSSDFAL